MLNRDAPAAPLLPEFLCVLTNAGILCTQESQKRKSIVCAISSLMLSDGTARLELRAAIPSTGFIPNIITVKLTSKFTSDQLYLSLLIFLKTANQNNQYLLTTDFSS